MAEGSDFSMDEEDEGGNAPMDTGSDDSPLSDFVDIDHLLDGNFALLDPFAVLNFDENDVVPSVSEENQRLRQENQRLQQQLQQAQARGFVPAADAGATSPAPAAAASALAAFARPTYTLPVSAPAAAAAAAAPAAPVPAVAAVPASIAPAPTNILFTKIRNVIGRYHRHMLNAKKAKKKPKRNFQIQGSARGLGNCIVCDQPAEHRLFELMTCGHVVCGSTSMHRGGCGRTDEATAHKQVCNRRLTLSATRRIKLHGMFFRQGNAYVHVNLTQFSFEEVGILSQEFRAAIQAFLAAHSVGGEVSVEIRQGCVEFVASFSGPLPDVATFCAFFATPHTERVFPPALFNVTELKACPGQSPPPSSSSEGSPGDATIMKTDSQGNPNLPRQLETCTSPPLPPPTARAPSHDMLSPVLHPASAPDADSVSIEENSSTDDVDCNLGDTCRGKLQGDVHANPLLQHLPPVTVMPMSDVMFHTSKAEGSCPACSRVMQPDRPTPLPGHRNACDVCKYPVGVPNQCPKCNRPIMFDVPRPWSQSQQCCRSCMHRKRRQQTGSIGTKLMECPTNVPQALEMDTSLTSLGTMAPPHNTMVQNAMTRAVQLMQGGHGLGMQGAHTAATTDTMTSAHGQDVVALPGIVREDLVGDVPGAGIFPYDPQSQGVQDLLSQLKKLAQRHSGVDAEQTERLCLEDLAAKAVDNDGALSLSNAQLGEEGAKALASVLACNQNIVTLKPTAFASPDCLTVCPEDMIFLGCVISADCHRVIYSLLVLFV
eukprot:m.421297 g.421297  ORF g.421297 m.421297 type:complete len:770 (-) comp20196_c2_seq10:85-2394(-)